MSETTDAITTADPQRLTDYIHDCWFRISEITFAEQAKSLQLKVLSELKKPYGLLTFTNVVSFIAEDTQKIDEYDINFIRFDKSKLGMEIVTNIPMKFVIQCKDPMISLILIK